MKQFITKYERSLVGVLSGWDRIRFRGTLRNLAVTTMMFSWLLDRRILLKDFKQFSLELTDTLKTSVEQVASLKESGADVILTTNTGAGSSHARPSPAV